MDAERSRGDPDAALVAHILPGPAEPALVGRPCGRCARRGAAAAAGAGAIGLVPGAWDPSDRAQVPRRIHPEARRRQGQADRRQSGLHGFRQARRQRHHDPEMGGKQQGLVPDPRPVRRRHQDGSREGVEDPRPGLHRGGQAGRDAEECRAEAAARRACSAATGSKDRSRSRKALCERRRRAPIPFPTLRPATGPTATPRPPSAPI